MPAAPAGPRAPRGFLGNAYQTHPDPFGSDLELTQRDRCIAFEKIWSSRSEIGALLLKRLTGIIALAPPARPPKTLDVRLIAPDPALVRSTSRSSSASAALSRSVPRTSPPVAISPSTGRKPVKAVVACRLSLFNKLVRFSLIPDIELSFSAMSSYYPVSSETQ